MRELMRCITLVHGGHCGRRVARQIGGNESRDRLRPVSRAPRCKAQGKAAEKNGRMLYFFRRAEDVIKCEIRLDWDGDGYELVIEAPDDVRVERFRESSELNERWAELERQLAGDGWSEPKGTRG